MQLKLLLDRRQYNSICEDGISVFADCNENANRILQLLKSDLKIEEIAKELNGSYFAIVDMYDFVYLISDRMCSMPVYFSVFKEDILVSDNAPAIQNIVCAKIDKAMLKLYSHSSFVPGNKTLLIDVFQIEAGQYIKINKQDGCFSCENYFDYSIRGSECKNYSFEDFRRDAQRISKQMREKLKGRHVYIPLSRGADSMFVASLVKMASLEDVVCYTYGNINAKEKKGSQKIANGLGLDWIFVEYTNKTWRSNRKDGSITRYSRYAGNYSNCIHVQDFPAVKNLLFDKTKEYIANTVFLPGHTGVIGGGNVKSAIFSKETYSKADRRIIYGKKDFNLWGKGAKIVDMFDSISDHFKEGSTTLEEEISFYQTWDMRERQAKAIIPSLRVYEYFGADWYLPMNDSVLMNNLYSMPLKMRLDKEIYKEYCRKLYEELAGSIVAKPTKRHGLKLIISKFVHPIHARIARILQVWNHDLRWFALATNQEKFYYIIAGGTAITSITTQIYIDDVVKKDI